MTESRLKSLAFATVLAIVLIVIVRSQLGDETFVCDTGECTLGSGSRWLATGAAFSLPFLATAGFRWSGMLERNDRLDPVAKWSVPDAEQILEVLAVLGAGFLAYRLALGGPSIELDEVGRINQWANDVRNFRLEDGAPSTDLVPSRLTWFLIGSIFMLPFAFSFGSVVGREFFGYRRRKAQAAANGTYEHHIDLDEGPDIDLDLDTDDREILELD